MTTEGDDGRPDGSCETGQDAAAAADLAVSGPLELLLRRYRRRGNPLDAWHAIGLALMRPEQPLPPELRVYLIKVAIALSKLQLEYRDTKAVPADAALVEALRLRRRGGGPSWWANAEDANDAQWLKLAARFFKRPKIAAKIASEYGISEKTVSRMLKRAYDDTDEQS